MNIKLPNFDNCNILVIGDIMLDRYWLGDTSRISPEAPVPVIHIKNSEERPGGASNVALNTSSLGCNTSLLGLVGQDDAAQKLQQLLEKAAIKCLFHTSKDLPTITKLRVLGRNQQLIRLDFEEPLTDHEIQQLVNNYKQQLAHTDLVIVSDYGKGIADGMKEIIKSAHNKKIPILVDPKSKDFSIYAKATIITPNFAEFEAVVGPCPTNEIIATKGMELIKKHHLEALLITRGAEGMTLLRKNCEPIHIPTHAREVYDVTGAGDTVIATLGACLAASADLVTATQLANLAAGIVVRKVGTAAVSPAELRRAIKKQQESWLGIVNEEQLLQEIADAKAHGETIVMTNGCFDILHAGHVSYLEQAKALGTRLIVAINDDASVQRLKGPKRPVNNLEQRMTVIAGLRSVDWVVPFSEDTPARLISAVSPHILVKGGDYQTDEIAGSKHVIASGGEVKILPYLDNHSTSTIIQRIKGNTE